MNYLHSSLFVIALFVAGVHSQEVKCFSTGSQINGLNFVQAFFDCSKAPAAEMNGEELMCILNKYDATDAESSRRVLNELADGPEGQQVFNQAVDTCASMVQGLDLMNCLAEKIYKPTGPCKDAAMLPS